jgi:ribonuclease P protein component
VAAEVRFRPEFRLHTPADFAGVFSQRKVCRGTRFHLHYRPGVGKDARLGLVIPKKHARAAPLRNLLKRIARESFRHARAGLPNMDLVLRLNKPVSGASAHDVASRRSWRMEIDVLLTQLPR